MSDSDKRMIPGEPESYDSFENSWWDDNDAPVDEDGVAENPAGKIFPRPDAMRFAVAIQRAKTLDEARAVVEEWKAIFAQRADTRSHGSGWGSCERLLRAIDGMSGKTEVKPFADSGGKRDVIRYVFPIFSCGNMKLPFWTWSKLPVVTCPGKGACSSICYSLKHLSQPAPCFTWAQNTLLAHFRRDIIAAAFSLLQAPTVLRIHVDGDFEDEGEVAFWMELLKTRPAKFSKSVQTAGVTSYVYSKSWLELIAYDEHGGTWPEHFFVNISSGSKWHNNPEIKRRVMSLPCVRGEFVIIDDASLPHRLPGQKMTDEMRDVMAEQRAAIVSQRMKAMYKKKFFVCQGKCAVCVETPKGSGHFSHACGSAKFIGVTIGIGKH